MRLALRRKDTPELVRATVCHTIDAASAACISYARACQPQLQKCTVPVSQSEPVSKARADGMQDLLQGT